MAFAFLYPAVFVFYQGCVIGTMIASYLSWLSSAFYPTAFFFQSGVYNRHYYRVVSFMAFAFYPTFCFSSQVYIIGTIVTHTVLNLLFF